MNKNERLELAQKIKLTRGARKLSQVLAAPMIGISLHTLQTIEQGGKLGTKTMQKITEWLPKE